MKDNKTLKYLEKLRGLGSSYGLESTKRLLQLLGNPHNKIKLIHIAGTNGKGSVTTMIARILKGSGYKVGTFKSPHLEEIEEMISVNEENISETKFIELLDEIKVCIKKMVNEGYNHPTEFEVVTCLMFLYFYRESVDCGVIEVGLGGRQDSTNVITPIMSVLTSISYDHTNILGNTLTQISGEKAGIIKKDIPVVVYPQEDEALSVIKNRCEEVNAKLYLVDYKNSELIEILKEDKIYQKVRIKGRNHIYEIKLPLLGQHQILNLSVAITAIEILMENKIINVDRTNIEKSIINLTWNGRLEVMKSSPLVVIDGAHNIQGIAKLKENIDKYFEYKNLYLILGILADKDVEEMIKIITPFAKAVYAVTPNSTRAELADDLKDEVLKYNINCIAFQEYDDALNKALEEANDDDIIVASGSLYMVGGMRSLMKLRKWDI